MSSHPAIEPQDAKNKQVDHLITAINAASFAIQGAIPSRQDFLRILQDQILDMNLVGGISILDQSGTQLEFQMVAYPKRYQILITKLERLAGIKADGHTVSIADVDVYMEAIDKQKAIFVPDSNTVFSNLVPKPKVKILRALKVAFGQLPGIFAPIIINEQVHGFLNVVGEWLTVGDVPAMEILTNYIAIALENARLISARQTSDKQIQDLIDNLPIGFFKTTADGQIVDVNPAMLDLLGYSDMELLLEKNAADFYVDAGERSRMQSIMSENGVVKDFETRFYKLDGSMIWISITSRPIYDQDGNIIQYEGLMKDITESKKAIQKIQDRTDELLFANEVGRAIIEGMSLADVFAIIDKRVGQLFDTNSLALLLVDDDEKFLQMHFLEIPSKAGKLVEGVIGKEIPKIKIPLVENNKYVQAILQKEVITFCGSEEISGFWSDFVKYLPFNGSIKNRLMKLMPRLQETAEIQSAVSVPLMFEDRPIGLLQMLGKREYNEQELNHLRIIFDLLTSAIHRQQIEEAISKSEERYRQVSDLVSDFAYAFRIEPDGELELEWVTEALVRISGWTADELNKLGGWQALIYPDDMDIPMQQLAALMAGETAVVEYRIMTKQGEIKWVRDYAHGQWDEQENRWVRIYGAVQDITNRRIAEGEIFDLKNFNEGIVQNVTDVIIITDSEGVITFLNPAMENLLDYPPDELIGEHWQRFVPPDQISIANAADVRRAQGQKDRYEIELSDKGGGRKTVVVSGTPIMEESTFTGTLAIFTDITERKRAEEKLLHDAFHDSLTKLPNRALFVDRLGQVIERSKRFKEDNFAVFFLDLDNFKDVNDSLGHIIGDKLLNASAQRLMKCVRATDTVARFGGDEFVILLDKLDDQINIIMLAERILEELKKPFNIDNHEVYTSTSIGIVYGNEVYDQPEDVLRDADTALYKAKDIGKNCYEVFTPSMRLHVVTRLQVEKELRRAIEEREFRLHYQPIYGLEDNKIKAFEALIRWQHPERGLLLPGEFLQISEDSGLIIPIGLWVLETACQQLRRWQVHSPIGPSLGLSVNLSEKQFNDPDLLSDIKRILQKTDVSPQNLKLEITERVVMENTALSARILSELRAFGTEIQMDDFGTGYSSLGVLHQFPIDTLKIDRLFITQMMEGEDKLSFVRTIVNLAHDLGIEAVAEGVETTEQIELLKALKCSYAQGYLFSQPIDGDAVLQMITTDLEYSYDG